MADYSRPGSLPLPAATAGGTSGGAQSTAIRIDIRCISVHVPVSQIKFTGTTAGHEKRA